MWTSLLSRRSTFNMSLINNNVNDDNMKQHEYQHQQHEYQQQQHEYQQQQHEYQQQQQHEYQPHEYQQSVLTMQKSVTITVTPQRSNSLDYLNFEEKRQLIASSLSLSDILQVGPAVAQAAKDVAAASTVIGKDKRTRQRHKTWLLMMIARQNSHVHLMYGTLDW